jgi:hypothetical protein
MSFNLAELNTATVDDVTFDVELEHPVKGPTGLVIQVIGSHSEKVRALRNRQTNELISQNFEASRTKKSTLTVETGTKRNAKLLAAATVGWFERSEAAVGAKPKIEPGLPFGDGRLMFSTEEAEKLYADPGFEWLTKQVDEAVSELSNFMRA